MLQGKQRAPNGDKKHRTSNDPGSLILDPHRMQHSLKKDVTTGPIDPRASHSYQPRNKLPADVGIPGDTLDRVTYCCARAPQTLHRPSCSDPGTSLRRTELLLPSGSCSRGESGP